MDLSIELKIAKELARGAGVVMLKYFRSAENGLENKDDGSPVTIADKMINRMVIEEIEKRFGDVVVGEEESTGEYGMGRRWICDPIDGTRPYVLGIPTAMFSLALAVDGKPVLGVAYDPFLDKLFTAVEGNGAFCNDSPIHVSNKQLAGSYVALTSSFKKNVEHPEVGKYILDKGGMVILFGGAVYKMCLVANGTFVGYFEDYINAHDCAAGHAIVTEAGGSVTRLDGKSLDYSKAFKAGLFSNGVVHDELVKAAKPLVP